MAKKFENRNKGIRRAKPSTETKEQRNEYNWVRWAGEAEGRAEQCKKNAEAAQQQGDFKEMMRQAKSANEWNREARQWREKIAQMSNNS